MLAFVTTLGDIIRDFMSRFNLTSNVKAGEVMGISDIQVRSYLEGVDVRTGKSLKRPRESTLLLMAERMNTHAISKGHPWRIGYEELLSAAGYAASGKTHLKVLEEAHRQAVSDMYEVIDKGPPKVQVGANDVPLSFLATPQEQRVVEDAARYGISYEPFRSEEFWGKSREERRPVFRALETLVDETKRLDVPPRRSRLGAAKEVLAQFQPKQAPNKRPPGVPADLEKAKLREGRLGAGRKIQNPEFGESDESD